MDRRALMGLIALMTTPGVTAFAGEFSGDPAVRLSGDGRTATLIESFSFKDDEGRSWDVPAGTVVDGASIPQPFWTFIGGPFEGRYRNASIVHDHYCVKRSRPWRAVHRVFYEGMIAGGVDEAKAKLMYYAVYKFGPRWEVRTVKVPRPHLSGPTTMEERTVAVSLPVAAYNEDEVAEAIRVLNASRPSLDEIDRLADRGGLK